MGGGIDAGTCVGTTIRTVGESSASIAWCRPRRPSGASTGARCLATGESLLAGESGRSGGRTGAVDQHAANQHSGGQELANAHPPLTELDDFRKTWKSQGGDTVRREFQDAR